MEAFRHVSSRSNMLTVCQTRSARKDSEVSPGTLPPRPAPTNSRGNIAPWESEPSTAPTSQSGNPPSTHRQPPSASPQSIGVERPTQMISSVFSGSYYNDSNENLGQISPGSTGYMGDGDDRRPSIASATTVSSTGSNPTGGGTRLHRKLQGFFGDEYKGLEEESGQNSESSSMQSSSKAALPLGQTPQSSISAPRNQNNGKTGSGPTSPTDSRPRTPAAGPNSEVTPWVFQDTQVRCMSPEGAVASRNTDM